MILRVPLLTRGVEPRLLIYCLKPVFMCSKSPCDSHTGDGAIEVVYVCVCACMNPVRSVLLDAALIWMAALHSSSAFCVVFSNNILMSCV